MKGVPILAASKGIIAISNAPNSNHQSWIVGIFLNLAPKTADVPLHILIAIVLGTPNLVQESSLLQHLS